MLVPRRSVRIIALLIVSAVSAIGAIVIDSGSLTPASGRTASWSYSALNYGNITNASNGIASIASVSGFSTSSAGQDGSSSDATSLRWVQSNAASGSITIEFDFANTGYTATTFTIDHDGLRLRGSRAGTAYPLTVKTLISFDGATYTPITSRTLSRSSSSDGSLLTAGSVTVSLDDIAREIKYTGSITKVYYQIAYESSTTTGGVHWGSVYNNGSTAFAVSFGLAAVPEPATAAILVGLVIFAGAMGCRFRLRLSSRNY